MTAIELGIVQVYTGDGKGKTTAAIGQAVRALGAGKRVAFVQFVKGGAYSSELAVLDEMGIAVERPALKPTGLLDKGITEGDRRAAAEAWEIAADMLGGFEYDVIVLDEIIVAMHYGLVDEAAVFEALDARSKTMDVVLTGRNASLALIERADLVTEMVPLKHPYDEGVSARLGIEY
ncbi:MAG: cob(I)yrinic acid a,c-diamide adenosyltransferase [Actinobacteria bacterium]|nr:cob(I)yrinic acid a,c-diamide adenosyltransferase [Actinomycetota bacterium]